MTGSLVCVTALFVSAGTAAAALQPGNLLANGDMEIEQLPNFPGFPDNWFASQTFNNAGVITGAFWDTANSVSATHSLGLIDSGIAGQFSQSEWRSFAAPIPAGATTLRWQWDVMYDITAGSTPQFTVNMRTGGPFINNGGLVLAVDHKVTLTGSSGGQFLTMTADIPVAPGEASFDIIFLTEGSKDALGSMYIDDVSVVALFALDGDLNGDGFVGIGDLNIVLGVWNQNVTPGDLLAGDPSGDGFVGIGDLNVVLGNWNAGTPPVAPGAPGAPGSAVPEPATLVWFSLASGLAIYRRRGLSEEPDKPAEKGRP